MLTSLANIRSQAVQQESPRVEVREAEEEFEDVELDEEMSDGFEGCEEDW
jgi:hypothetical protein